MTNKCKCEDECWCFASSAPKARSKRMVMVVAGFVIGAIAYAMRDEIKKEIKALNDLCDEDCCAEDY